jgi:hypothetical protein
MTQLPAVFGFVAPMITFFALDEMNWWVRADIIAGERERGLAPGPAPCAACRMPLLRAAPRCGFGALAFAPKARPRGGDSPP